MTEKEYVELGLKKAEIDLIVEYRTKIAPAIGTGPPVEQHEPDPVTVNQVTPESEDLPPLPATDEDDARWPRNKVKEHLGIIENQTLKRWIDKGYFPGPTAIDGETMVWNPLIVEMWVQWRAEKPTRRSLVLWRKHKEPSFDGKFN